MQLREICIIQEPIAKCHRASFSQHGWGWVGSENKGNPTGRRAGGSEWSLCSRQNAERCNSPSSECGRPGQTEADKDGDHSREGLPASAFLQTSSTTTPLPHLRSSTAGANSPSPAVDLSTAPAFELQSNLRPTQPDHPAILLTSLQPRAALPKIRLRGSADNHASASDWTQGWRGRPSTGGDQGDAFQGHRV